MTHYFIGIDIAKYEHVASIYDSFTGEYILDSLHFTNDSKGFKQLLVNLSELKKEEMIVGFESTAHYHQTLFSYLTGKGYRCYLINPFMTNRFRSVSLRDAKNDDIDSRTIAAFLSFEYKKLKEEEFLSNELKELCLQRDYLIKQLSKDKIKLISYLDKVFPELEDIVTKAGIYSRAIRAILREYPTARDISAVRIDHLISLSDKASKGKYPSTKIRKLKETARVSVGYHSAAIGLKIRHSVQSQESIEKQIDEIETMIKQHPIVSDSPLFKLKGINAIEIGYIMSAIISIDRFDSPGKIVALAGLDPKIRQSGTWSAPKTRMSKRGNKLLRYALIWTAYNMTRYESRMKSYYEKKRAEGKSHYNALGHCAGKLCRYIFFILKHPEAQFIN